MKSASDSDESDRLAQSALIRDAISNAELDPVKFDITVYRKAYRSIEGVINEPSDHMIMYVAPSYDQSIQIPDLILDRIPKYQFKTITMLSTKRYLVESDNVMIPRITNGT